MSKPWRQQMSDQQPSLLLGPVDFNDALQDWLDRASTADLVQAVSQTLDALLVPGVLLGEFGSMSDVAYNATYMLRQIALEQQQREERATQALGEIKASVAQVLG